MSTTGKRKSQKFEAASQRKSLSKLDAAKRIITEKEILKLFDTNDGSLEFNEKKLGDQGCSFIVDVLMSHGKSPKRIDFFGNELTDECVPQLVLLMTKTDSILKELVLEYNSLGNQGAKDLAQCLALNPPLIRLSLYQNNVSDEGCKAFAKALESNRNLKYLVLYGNKITSKGAIYFCKYLRNNTTLQNLDIHNNIDVDEDLIDLIEDYMKRNAGKLKNEDIRIPKKYEKELLDQIDSQSVVVNTPKKQQNSPSSSSHSIGLQSINKNSVMDSKSPSETKRSSDSGNLAMKLVEVKRKSRPVDYDEVDVGVSTSSSSVTTTPTSGIVSHQHGKSKKQQGSSDSPRKSQQELDLLDAISKEEKQTPINNASFEGNATMSSSGSNSHNNNNNNNNMGEASINLASDIQTMKQIKQLQDRIRELEKRNFELERFVATIKKGVEDISAVKKQ